MTKKFQIFEIEHNSFTCWDESLYDSKVQAEETIRTFPKDYMSKIKLTILEVYVNE